MTKKKFLTKLLKTFVLILISAIVGSILIYLTKWIPQSAVKDNVSGSVVTLLNEPEYVWNGVAGSKLDNFTDGLILNIAFTETGNKFLDTMLSPYLKFPDSIDPTGPLYSYIYENDSSIITQEYARYWHGHQIIIKPLLCLFSISSIRFINMICQILALFCVLLILNKKNHNQLIPPIIVMWITLIPGATFQSLQYSPVYYITMFAMFAIIANYERDDKWEISYIFELVGILTAFFDLLTYPIVSLGVPLILLFSLSRKSGTLKKNFIQLLRYSIMWSIGYLGMFAAKWIIASIFTPNNIIASAFQAFLTRSSNNVSGYTYTFLDSILCNAKMYRNGIFLILLLIIFSYAVFLLIKNRKFHINISLILAVCAVALYPIAWYMFTINHSVIHAIFTYRDLSITWYAFATALLLQDKKEK